jgi:hypothetical protein
MFLLLRLLRLWMVVCLSLEWGIPLLQRKGWVVVVVVLGLGPSCRRCRRRDHRQYKAVQAAGLPAVQAIHLQVVLHKYCRLLDPAQHLIVRCNIEQLCRAVQTGPDQGARLWLGLGHHRRCLLYLRGWMRRLLQSCR